MTPKPREFLKLFKALIIGIPFLFFSAKLFINDYQIDKRIENELFLDSSLTKSFTYKTLPVLKKATSSEPTELILNLTGNKSYYSDKFNEILFNSNSDTSLFSNGHKAIIKFSKEHSLNGINQFVELNIDGKQLLNIEQGSDDYKKTEGKYFLLVLGIILTCGGIFSIYFFKKSKS